MKLSAALYIIATPIGNLNDLSSRATSILSELDVIACEDTRRTRALLAHLNISPRELCSIHDEKEGEKTPLLLQKVKEQGLSLGLVCDSGTPCISDPGFYLVQHAHAQSIKVIPIPGACAIPTLLSASGLPPLPFLAVGFLPNKTAGLLNMIQRWNSLRPVTIIFYESPKRIQSTLQHIADLYPEAKTAVGRELTKIYEEILVGTSGSVAANFSGRAQVKGEFAVAIHLDRRSQAEISPDDQGELIANLKKIASEEGLSGRSVKKIAKLFRLPKDSFYGKET